MHVINTASPCVFSLPRAHTRAYQFSALSQLRPCNVLARTSSSSKRADFFWSKMLRNVLKWMKINNPTFGISIFQIWRSKFNHLAKKIHPKCCAMFWNRFFSSWVYFFAIFSSWDMVDSTFNIRSELETWRFLRTWFRNANQWYPITSWLGVFDTRISEA